VPVTPFHHGRGAYPVHGSFVLGGNPFLIRGSFYWMQALCAGAGVLGLAAWALAARRSPAA
jgi:hypothetical protein